MNSHIHGSCASDSWLTPPELIKALGKFDTDPCCEIKMPWKTASKMYTRKDNGLNQIWKGRVWLNPPYSKPGPWMLTLSQHKNGIALVSPKALDTKWGQQALLTCSCAYFLAGRMLFHYPNGEKSTGKFLSNMLFGFGKQNVEAIKKIKNQFPGILMRRV